MEAVEVADIKSELTFSPEIGKLAEALAAAHKGFKPVKKETINPFYNKKYAELSNVIEATDEALSNNGLAIIQSPGLAAPNKVRVTTLLLHTSGQWIKDVLELPMSKPDAQGAGASITYARRYSYQSFVSVAAEPDDDGNAASGKQITVSDGQATVSKPAAKTTTKPVQKTNTSTAREQAKVPDTASLPLAEPSVKAEVTGFVATDDDIPSVIGSKPTKPEMNAYGERFKALKVDMNKIGNYLRKKFEVAHPSSDLTKQQWEEALKELEGSDAGKLKELVG